MSSRCRRLMVRVVCGEQWVDRHQCVHDFYGHTGRWRMLGIETCNRSSLGWLEPGGGMAYVTQNNNQQAKKAVAALSPPVWCGCLLSSLCLSHGRPVFFHYGAIFGQASKQDVDEQMLFSLCRRRETISGAVPVILPLAPSPTTRGIHNQPLFSCLLAPVNASSIDRCRPTSF